jgi:hypothetical protein
MTDLTTMTDQELADAYLQAVALNQQANIEKRVELSTKREAIAEMYRAIPREIARRGCIWQVGITGDVWLTKVTP